MLYLLWGILNVVLSISFIVICFMAIKLIQEKMGLFAAVIFVLGLLLSAGDSRSNSSRIQANGNKFNHFTFYTRDNVEDSSTSWIELTLEQTLVSRYQLLVTYGQEKHSKLYVPLTASSDIIGFVSGIRWNPISIQVDEVRNDKFFYSVHGITEWKLFNATLYSQPKYYSGTTPVKLADVQAR